MQTFSNRNALANPSKNPTQLSNLTSINYFDKKFDKETTAETIILSLVLKLNHINKMPINSRAIVQVLEQVSLQKGLKCTISESLKGAATVGTFALGGGLLGGPVGLGIGGTLGSVIAAFVAQGKFKSVASVLSEEMTARQKMQLERSFRDIFRDIDANDVATAMALIMRSSSLQALILKQLGVFLKNEMGLQLQ